MSLTKISVTSVLFACWSILGVIVTLVARTRARNPAVFHGTSLPHAAVVPHAFLGLALAFPVSFPLFALIFFLTRQFSRDPLRESLGVLQFGVAVVPQLLIPVSVVISQLAAHGGPQPNSHNPMLDRNHVVSLALFTASGILIAWIVSLVIFLINVYITIRENRS